ncbi:MAG: hypothetical protein ABSH21_12825 [Verrucomicrobiia bacterium]|jgi:hypothetical protein
MKADLRVLIKDYRRQMSGKAALAGTPHDIDQTEAPNGRILSACI